MVCNCPSASCSYTPPANDYTCKPKGTCSSNADCDPNYCCDRDASGPGGSGQCVGKGIYSGNPKYLCDPPGWEIVSKGINPFI